MGWIEFAAAMGLFLASHRIPALFGVKQRLLSRLGKTGYMILFSLFSTVLLFWVIWAAGRAPVVTLWEQGVAARWAVNLVMPLCILLAVFGTAAANPFAFEGRMAGFDPERPGIVGITRQPLLWALLLWSGAHLWANGDLAHGILFGVFALFSGLGMKIVERRKRRDMGEDTWVYLSRHTGLWPFGALLRGKWRPKGRPSLVRVGLALLSWGAVWHLHGPVIGVSPMP